MTAELKKWRRIFYRLRACLHGGGGRQAGEVTRLGDVKKTLLYMPSSSPANPGCTFSRLLNGRYISHVKKKNAGKLLVLAINALLTHLLLLLQPLVLWLSIITFYNDAKPPPKWIWCITNPTPARRVTPPWNVYVAKFDSGWEGYPVWQTGLVALASHPTYHVNVIRLKWEDIWNGGLPHLSRLLHLPGAPPSPMQTKNWPVCYSVYCVDSNFKRLLAIEFLIMSRLTRHKCVLNVCIQR